MALNDDYPDEIPPPQANTVLRRKDDNSAYQTDFALEVDTKTADTIANGNVWSNQNGKVTERTPAEFRGDIAVWECNTGAAPGIDQVPTFDGSQVLQPTTFTPTDFTAFPSNPTTPNQTGVVPRAQGGTVGDLDTYGRMVRYTTTAPATGNLTTHMGTEGHPGDLALVRSATAGDYWAHKNSATGAWDDLGPGPAGAFLRVRPDSGQAAMSTGAGARILWDDGATAYKVGTWTYNGTDGSYAVPADGDYLVETTLSFTSSSIDNAKYVYQIVKYKAGGGTPDTIPDVGSRTYTSVPQDTAATTRYVNSTVHCVIEGMTAGDTINIWVAVESTNVDLFETNGSLTIRRIGA